MDVYQLKLKKIQTSRAGFTTTEIFVKKQKQNVCHKGNKINIQTRIFSMYIYRRHKLQYFFLWLNKGQVDLLMQKMHQWNINYVQKNAQVQIMTNIYVSLYNFIHMRSIKGDFLRFHESFPRNSTQ